MRTQFHCILATLKKRKRRCQLPTRFRSKWSQELKHKRAWSRHVAGKKSNTKRRGLSDWFHSTLDQTYFNVLVHIIWLPESSVSCSEFQIVAFLIFPPFFRINDVIISKKENFLRQVSICNSFINLLLMRPTTVSLCMCAQSQHIHTPSILT